MNCSNCRHSCCGRPDPLCDYCDECRNDSDTGWGGFTDHSIGKHFNSEKERQTYLEDSDNEDYDDDFNL